MAHPTRPVLSADELWRLSVRKRSEDLRQQSRWLCAVSRRLCPPKLRGGSDGAPTRTERTIEKTRRGGLPAPRDGKTLVGFGSAKNCNGCGEVIDFDDREFGVEVSEAISFRFHAECHKAWVTFFRSTAPRSPA